MEQLEKTSTQVYRRCYKCGGVKPIAEFHRDRAKSKGRHHKCGQCSNEDSKRWRAANTSYHKKWNWLHQAYFFQWRLRHPGYWARRAREWRDARPHYDRDRYRGIQDKIGYHSGIEDAYPAYRMIKSLETAEVVEIKL